MLIWNPFLGTKKQSVMTFDVESTDTKCDNIGRKIRTFGMQHETMWNVSVHADVYLFQHAMPAGVNLSRIRPQ